MVLVLAVLMLPAAIHYPMDPLGVCGEPRKAGIILGLLTRSKHTSRILGRLAIRPAHGSFTTRSHHSFIIPMASMDVG